MAIDISINEEVHDVFKIGFDCICSGVEFLHFDLGGFLNPLAEAVRGRCFAQAFAYWSEFE